jgi:hypothetical protein
MSVFQTIRVADSPRPPVVRANGQGEGGAMELQYRKALLRALPSQPTTQLVRALGNQA